MSVSPRVLGIDVSSGGGLVGARMAGMKVVGSLESSKKDIACLLSNGIPCYYYDKPMDFTAVARTDVIFCCHRGESSMEKLRLSCQNLHPRALVVEDWDKLPGKVMDGFVEYRDILEWSSFGCPVNDARRYVVAFQEDMLPLCRFPFPDGTGRRIDAKPKLDQNPDPNLFLTEKESESVRKRQSRNRAKGFRFGPKYVVDGGSCPRIPKGFYLDRRYILVDDKTRLRKLSVGEVMRLMGMPDGWKLPKAIHDSYRLASTTSPPPVLKALFDELLVWLL
jgi:hypothetical protein